MKKRLLLSTLCAVLLAASPALAQQEVLANKPDVTFNELSRHINTLAQQDSEESKMHLRLEAEAMSKSEEEDFLSMSAAIYERLLDDAEKAEEIKAQIQTNFPKGKAARSKAFSKVLTADSLSATEIEEQYHALLLEFPKESFKESDRDIYDNALIAIAGKYAKEGNVDKAIALAKVQKGSKYYVYTVHHVHENISGEKPLDTLLPLIEDAYTTAKAAAESEDEALKNSTDARFFSSIASVYANALVESGKVEEGLAIAKPRLEKIGYNGYNADTYVKIITKALERQGKKEEALSVLEEFITQGDKNKDINEHFRKLYTDVHGPDADVEAVLAEADRKAKEALYAKYEQEMIKEEAPGFTLLNRDGVEVSLTDYKGKIVVLDFWATWCGPCVVSFPGMQQAVNNYESDPDVEFLFIDTWQREENYQELVEEFITKNGYTFHVLFDEMKDRSKAVVSAYGVQGIPTKVVIDKEGFIRFKTAGGSDNIDKIVSELETKIELARKG